MTRSRGLWRTWSISKKYRNLSPETLAAHRSDLTSRSRESQDALKTAKRKLHQVFAAYSLPGGDASLDDIPRVLVRELRTTRRCGPVPVENGSADTPRPPSVWLPRPPLPRALARNRSAWYSSRSGVRASSLCATLDGPGPVRRSIAPATSTPADHGLNEFLPRSGPGMTASCQDLIVSPPSVTEPWTSRSYSRAFLVWSSNGKTSAFKSCDRLRARYTIISFPLKSLGGHRKGMRETYQKVIEEIAESLSMSFRSLTFPNEVFQSCRPVLSIGTPGRSRSVGTSLRIPPALRPGIIVLKSFFD